MIVDLNRVGKTLLTLLVDNQEDRIVEFKKRGLTTSAIGAVPGLYRKAVMTDPDGNMISLGQDLSVAA